MKTRLEYYKIFRDFRGHSRSKHAAGVGFRVQGLSETALAPTMRAISEEPLVRIEHLPLTPHSATLKPVPFTIP